MKKFLFTIILFLCFPLFFLSLISCSKEEKTMNTCKLQISAKYNNKDLNYEIGDLVTIKNNGYYTMQSIEYTFFESLLDSEKIARENDNIITITTNIEYTEIYECNTYSLTKNNDTYDKNIEFINPVINNNNFKFDFNNLNSSDGYYIELTLTKIDNNNRGYLYTIGTICLFE